MLAVAAVAAGVTFYLVSSHNQHSPGGQSTPPPSSQGQSSPSGTAATQAAAVNSLLMTSGQTRGELGPAVNDIQNSCASISSSQLASDVATIQTVAMQRKSEYDQATNLQTDALANGAQLKSDLLSALQYSMNADNDYLKWARQEQSGCFPATSSGDFNAAGTADDQAVAAKTSFANVWNQIAPQYGYATVTQGDI
jgi:hypothetical protein